MEMKDLANRLVNSSGLNGGVLEPTNLQLVSSVTGQVVRTAGEPMTAKDLAAAMTLGNPMPISSYVSAAVRYIKSRSGQDLRLRLTLSAMAFTRRVRSCRRAARTRRVRRVARPAAGRADPPAPAPARGPEPEESGRAGLGHRHGDGLPGAVGRVRIVAPRVVRARMVRARHGHLCAGGAS
jgi:hypothetical protein